MPYGPLGITLKSAANLRLHLQLIYPKPPTRPFRLRVWVTKRAIHQSSDNTSSVGSQRIEPTYTTSTPISDIKLPVSQSGSYLVEAQWGNGVEQQWSQIKKLWVYAEPGRNEDTLSPHHYNQQGQQLIHESNNGQPFDIGAYARQQIRRYFQEQHPESQSIRPLEASNGHRTQSNRPQSAHRGNANYQRASGMGDSRINTTYHTQSSKLAKTPQLTATQKIVHGFLSQTLPSSKSKAIVLSTRHTRNMQEYIDQTTLAVKPINPTANTSHTSPMEQKLIRQQALLSSLQLYQDLYREDQGRQLGKNDWFLGPFYTYQQNEKQMRKR